MGRAALANCLCEDPSPWSLAISPHSVQVPFPRPSLGECLTLFCGFPGKGPFTYFLLRKLTYSFQVGHGTLLASGSSTHTLELLSKMASPWDPYPFLPGLNDRGPGLIKAQNCPL